MSGWILLHRKLIDHWLWQDPKNFHRWVTILFYVNHSPAKFLAGNELEICEPGASYRSLDEWARLLKTNKKQVKIFFELLEKESMIECKILGKGNRRKHLLTVTNWNKYQNIGTENGTGKVPEKEPKKLPKKHPEQIKSNKGLKYPFNSEEFISSWGTWKEYKKKEHQFNYKSEISEQAALKQLIELSEGNEEAALKIIKYSIANGYKGLFLPSEVKPKNGFNKNVPDRKIKDLTHETELH